MSCSPHGFVRFEMHDANFLPLVRSFRPQTEKNVRKKKRTIQEPEQMMKPDKPVGIFGLFVG